MSKKKAKGKSAPKKSDKGKSLKAAEAPPSPQPKTGSARRPLRSTGYAGPQSVLAALREVAWLRSALRTESKGPVHTPQSVETLLGMIPHKNTVEAAKFAEQLEGRLGALQRALHFLKQSALAATVMAKVSRSFLASLRPSHSVCLYLSCDPLICNSLLVFELLSWNTFSSFHAHYAAC